MSKNINGTDYKVVYLDTNAISDMAKNYKNTMVNLLERFGFADANADSKYAFATSVYNLKELSNSMRYRNEITNMFDQIPLLVMQAFPSIIDIEASNEDPFYLSIGIKPLFKTNISDVFMMFDSNGFEESNNQFENHINQEISNWSQAKIDHLENKELFNNSYKIYNVHDNDIDICYNTKSAKLFTFIKTYFLYKKSDPIISNSVIDTYNASSAPFVDVYIGERVVTSWLKQSKDKYDFMNKVEIFKISEFYDSN